MTVFILKMIAVLAMISDHLGVVLGEWNLSPNSTIFALRSVGRLAFPIFAFLIANGWIHTRDKKKYFSNMVLFACISQTPYTLTFYPVNQMKLSADSTAFYFPHLSVPQISILVAFVALAVFVYYYFVLKKKWEPSIVLSAIALAITPLSLKLFNVWVLSSELNVFYTLALGIYAIYCWDLFVPLKKRPIYEYVILLPLVLSGVLLQPDYGVAGVLLILFLHIFKNRWLQCAVICLWGILFFGVQLDNWGNVAITAIAAALVFFYNGKKGLSAKAFFYSFYPAHLAVLGAINMFFRFHS